MWNNNRINIQNMPFSCWLLHFRPHMKSVLLTGPLHRIASPYRGVGLLSRTQYFFLCSLLSSIASRRHRRGTLMSRQCTRWSCWTNTTQPGQIYNSEKSYRFHEKQFWIFHVSVARCLVRRAAGRGPTTFRFSCMHFSSPSPVFNDDSSAVEPFGRCDGTVAVLSWWPLLPNAMEKWLHRIQSFLMARDMIGRPHAWMVSWVSGRISWLGWLGWPGGVWLFILIKERKKWNAFKVHLSTWEGETWDLWYLSKHWLRLLCTVSIYEEDGE